MRIENQSAFDQAGTVATRHTVLRRTAIVFGAILLLALGLRFLFVFGINSFPVSEYDAVALRNQAFALFLFAACQLGGGALLRLIFRKPIPEIDRNEGKLDRCFSVLRWSLLFLVLSGLTAFLVLLYVRGSHAHFR